ncbi:MAG: hypothetical protein GY926_10375 [bacterium]|nr:hypothetical protein [bacterium]
MRTLIRFTATAMILTALSPLAIGVADTSPGGTFADDDTSIHEGSIEAIAASGITQGCNPPLNTRFCPTNSVTRGEMAAFLVRALELPSAAAAGFTDTTTSIFADDIDRLAAAQITVGCNPPANTRFCPNEAVSREQMAAFLSRGLGLVEATADSFVDDNESLFEADIEKLRAAGITNGCNPPSNDRFCPTSAVTRAEMATFVARALDLEEIEVLPHPYTVDVVSRESWGAKPAADGLRPHSIQQITIHHSDDTTSTTGPALYRIWQGWHQSLGWPDVAYHFIVGRDGTVFEGRPDWAAGDTATEYDPHGHFLIVVEGDYNSDIPSPQQLETLAQMVAWASTTFDVPIDTISGHRDHAATSCPGENLYHRVHDGTITERAETILDEGGVSLVVGSG